MSPNDIERTPTPLDRFDLVLQQFAGRVALEPGWRPIPQEGVFLFIVERGSPYSSSIYYEPKDLYVRRSHLDRQNPYANDNNYDKALEALAQIEEITKTEDV